MSQYHGQVGGHQGTLIAGSNSVIKPTNQTEIKFYKDAQSVPKLLLFLPSFIGCQGDMLEMEDLLTDIEEPCVIDIKIGQRLYDDSATPEKKEKMIKQAFETTSGSLGLRICGAKIISSHSSTQKDYGKEFGRNLNDSTFSKGLESLFTNSKSEKTNPLILKSIQSTLSDLSIIFNSSPGLRMYGASLLIVYDGKYAWDHTARPPIMKLIDFAHSEFSNSQTIQLDLILALENLSKFIDDIIN